MTRFLTLNDADVSGKTVLARADLNVPMADGRVTDATRVCRLIPALKRPTPRGATPAGAQPAVASPRPRTR